MSETFQLRVPTPCHENWDKMNEAEKGRFCLSCQKQVIDFSLMTDRQMLDIISKASGNLCGHFMQDQLNREMTLKKERNPGWFRYVWQVAIPAMLLAEKTSAQDFRKEKIECSAPRLTGDIVMMTTVGKLALHEQPNSLVRVNGLIRDEQGLPMAGATVMIKGTKNGTSTDVKGRFQFRLTDHSKRITLVASSVGYTTLETTMKFGTLSSDSVKIEMVLSPQMMGLMEVVRTKKMNFIVDTLQAVRALIKKAVGIEKTSLKTNPDPAQADSSIAVVFDRKEEGKIENSIGPEKNAVRVYPNPVQPGSSLSVAFDLKEGGEFEIFILTVSGQMLQQKQVLFETGKHVEQIVCDSRMTRGMYILEAVNRKTKKRYTSRILVD